MPRKPRKIANLEVPRDVDRGVRKAGGFREVARSAPGRAQLRREAKKHLALSDPTRLRILFALDASELCPCLLKKIARISDSKLSYHLAILHRAGLIHSRRTMNWRVYSVTKAGTRAIAPARR